MHIARSLRFFIISFASFIRLVGGRGRRGGMLWKSHLMSTLSSLKSPSHHNRSHRSFMILSSVLTYSGCLAPDRACGGNRDSQPRIKSVGFKERSTIIIITCGPLLLLLCLGQSSPPNFESTWCDISDTFEAAVNIEQHQHHHKHYTLQSTMKHCSD